MVMVRVEGEGKGGVGGKPKLPNLRIDLSSAKAWCLPSWVQDQGDRVSP